MEKLGLSSDVYCKPSRIRFEQSFYPTFSSLKNGIERILCPVFLFLGAYSVKKRVYFLCCLEISLTLRVNLFRVNLNQ